MMRRRRPLARGAMVAGVGYAAGRSGAKKAQHEADQEQRIDQLEAQQQGTAPQTPVPTAPPTPAPVAPPTPAPTAPPTPAPVAPPTPAPTAADDRIEQLVKLKGLLDAGVLTQAEFDAEKAKILAS